MRINCHRPPATAEPRTPTTSLLWTWPCSLRSSRHVNVCVEMTGYRPVLLDDLIMLASDSVARRSTMDKPTLERIEIARNRLEQSCERGPC